METENDWNAFLFPFGCDLSEVWIATGMQIIPCAELGWGVCVHLFDRFGGADQPGVLGPSWRIQSILRVLPGKVTLSLTPPNTLSGPLHNV